MKWRPHTEKPAEIPVTAIIAIEDPEDGERYLLWGIYTFTAHKQQWWNEDDCKGIAEPVFWWLPEEELLAQLPK